MRYRTERTIPRPRPEVFRVFTDLERAPERISAIEEIDVLTEGPMRVGTEFRETRVMFGKKATETMKVTEFEPDRGYATTAESHGARYRAEYAFEDVPEGTKVTFEFEGTPVSFFAKISSPLLNLLFGRMLKRCLEKDLDELSAAIVGGAGVAEPKGA